MTYINIYYLQILVDFWAQREYICRHEHTPPYVLSLLFPLPNPMVEFSLLNAVQSNLLQVAGTPSTTPGCSEPCPI